MVTDTYRHKGMRQKLVQGLKKKGIHDESILEAMMSLPRHYFLDKAFEDWAYQDKAFPIDCDQTISQPYTVAYQTMLLELKKGEKVLEIGTGSGYQAAILHLLGARVFSIERHQKLYEQTTEILKKHGFDHIRTYHGDGYEGLEKMAPFDKILLTAAATEIPQKLVEQLKSGGKMVLPLGDLDIQKMVRITKSENGTIQKEVFDDFVFVPFVRGVE